MYLSTKIIKVYRLLELKIDWLIVYNVYVQLENISFKWMETMPLSVKICNLGHKFGSNGGGVGVFTVEHLLLHGASDFGVSSEWPPLIFSLFDSPYFYPQPHEIIRVLKNRIESVFCMFSTCRSYSACIFLLTSSIATVQTYLTALYLVTL